MNLSNRIKHMNLSPIRKLSSDVINRKSKGINIYNLNIGQPDLKISNVFFESIKNYSSDLLRYTESNGDKNLIDSIINHYKHYNISFNYKDILITNGASEAISFSLLAICDIGDNILIPEPFYTNYLNFAKSSSINVKGIKTDEFNNYHLPKLEDIEKQIDNKTKAILLSNPCNPTGTVYTKEEINMIKDIAIKHNLWIISDEVYRDFIYDDIEFTSFASIKEIEDRVILIDSVSKKFSACGARIGFIASENTYLTNEILKLCQTRLCVPTLEQIGATALYNLTPKDLELSILKYKKRRDILYNEISQIPDIICNKPNGAFYIMVKIPNINTEHFAKWLINEYSLNNETICICPAKGFYLTEGLGEDEIRLSYVLNESDLISASNILKEGLKEYKNYNTTRGGKLE